MGLILEQNYSVRTYEADFNNKLKISSMFNYMQEAAAIHADKLGFGYKDLMPKNQAWVLSRALLEVQNSASFGDEVTVVTWAKDIDKLFALRDFLIKDKSGTIIARATTAWILLDFLRKRPLKVDGVIEHRVAKDQILPAIDRIPDKIENPDDKELADERRAYYDDIDLNQHVNNVKFIEYIFDVFEKDFFTESKVKSFQINFLSEIKFNDKIKIYKSNIQADKIYVEGTKEDKKLFQSMIEIGK